MCAISLYQKLIDVDLSINLKNIQISDRKIKDESIQIPENPKIQYQSTSILIFTISLLCK